MKRIRVMLLFLLLGAVVNVGVAWGCALWVPYPIVDATDIPIHALEWPMTPPPDFAPRPTRIGNFARQGFRWNLFETQYMPENRRTPVERGLSLTRSKIDELEPIVANGEDSMARANLDTLRDQQESMERWLRGTLLGNKTPRELEVVSAGWPLSALTGHHWNMPPNKPRPDLSSVNRPLTCGTIVTGINPLPRSGLITIRLRLIPVHPVPAAFVANTFLYAFVLWLVICGPFTLRCHIRRKRGLCVNCGYNLKGAAHEVCPECGALFAREKAS